MSPSDIRTVSSGELLRRGLSLGEGFALYVVAAEQLATRDAFVRSLGENPTLALAVVEVVELANAAIDRPVEMALRKLVADHRRHVVVVTGLEELAERVPELMARLNEYRNELRARINGALVFLGTPELLHLVQQQAPDMWSARASDLELDEEPPSWRPPSLRPGTISDEAEAIIECRHELEQLPHGRGRGRLAMKLADALRRRGGPQAQSARAYYEQAAAELDEPAERALALARAAGLEGASSDALAAARTAVRQLDGDAIAPELGRYPVDNAQYAEFLRHNPEVEEPRYWGDRRFNHPRQPVVGVSWWDARSFCEWAGLALPTEAQWEYACRAGTTTQYWSGDGEEDLARVGWYGEDPVTCATHPVGEKAPNPFGLYDMHGNVHEWCEDAWNDTFEGSMPRAGDGLRAQPIGVRWRIVRGGSWLMPALGVRSAYRYGRLPHYRSFDLGFRPALLRP